MFTAALPTTRSGCLNTSSGSLPDSFPLILGKGRDDVKVELSTCCCGIDRLRQRREANSLLFELGDEVIQFSHVPSQPIKTPYNEGIAITKNIKRGGKLRPCL